MNNGRAIRGEHGSRLGQATKLERLPVRIIVPWTAGRSLTRSLPIYLAIRARRPSSQIMSSYVAPPFHPRNKSEKQKQK
jgi:hypothetical protein